MPSGFRVLIVTMVALAAGCASHPRSRTAVVVPANASRVAIATQARMHAGTAYRPGGGSPGGFDCSGFVHFLYGQAGVALPRTAEAQSHVGRDLRSRDIAAGDLVFFRTDGGRISHVGIAVGDGRFIHAPNSRSRVRTDRLDDAYWADRFAGGRRIVER